MTFKNNFQFAFLFAWFIQTESEQSYEDNLCQDQIKMGKNIRE